MRKNIGDVEPSLFEGIFVEKKDKVFFFSSSIIYGIFLGIFIYLTKFNADLSQCYMGVNNYPFTASIIRELSVFQPVKNENYDFFKSPKNLKISRNYGQDSILNDQNIKKDQNIKEIIVIDRIRNEINQLRGCGDALFISPGILVQSVYIYIYVYTYIYLCLYIHMYIFVYMYMNICVYICIFLYVCI
jgi:hypothetical protein